MLRPTLYKLHYERQKRSATEMSARGPAYFDEQVNLARKFYRKRASKLLTLSDIQVLE